MRIKKWYALIVFLLSSFFLFSMHVQAISIDESYGGIPILFESNSENVHVELMVLRSDFDEAHINSSINEGYKTMYPNYASYTHLIDGDEISYFAYIDGAYMHTEDTAFVFDDVNNYKENIQHVRLVIFSTDGEVLASSELYEHIESTMYYRRIGYYKVDLVNYTFMNTRQLEFNWLYVILWVIIFFIAFFVLAVKYLLNLIFGVRYKNFLKALIFDACVIIGGAFAMHFLYNIVISGLFSNLLYVATALFLFQNVIGFFLLIQEKSRTKYIIASLLYYLPVFLVLRFIVYPFMA